MTQKSHRDFFFSIEIPSFFQSDADSKRAAIRQR
jgi:hypothetical protein